MPSARSGASGSGSASLSPSGVALITTSGRNVPRAGSARAPLVRAHSAKSRARAASRETTCRSALACAAATATARAAPPVPTTSQRPPPSAPSRRSESRMPATSVLSPTRAPCSVQKVLHAPTRAHRSVLRVTHRSTASLCGSVTLPAAPTAASAESTVASAAAGVGSATYTASRPSATIAAFCMTGDSEWATGSPSTTSRRVLALTSTRELFDDALDRREDEAFQLGAGVAVDVEIAAERVAHFGLVALAAGILAQHEHAALAPELVHPGPVVARHGEDQVGALDQLAGQQPGTVARQVEPAFEADEIRAFGHGSAVPRTGAGGGHLNAFAAALGQRALEQGCRERTATDVSRAHQQDAFRVRLLGATGRAGRRRAAARRASGLLHGRGAAAGPYNRRPSREESSRAPRHPVSAAFPPPRPARNRARSPPRRAPAASQAR